MRSIAGRGKKGPSKRQPTLRVQDFGSPLPPVYGPVTRVPVCGSWKIPLVLGGIFVAVNLLTSTLSAPAQAAPFIPEDFGPSQRQAWRPANEVAPNLLLSTLAAPERDAYLWSNRTIAQPVPGSWSSSTLPLLRTDPLPFAFEDWQGQPPAKAPARWDAPNLLTSTLAAPPIRLTDWSGTRGLARSYGFEPPNLLATTLAALPATAPFTPADWSTPRAQATRYAFDQQNLLLTALAPTAPVVLPFAQYDWPLPKIAARIYTFDAPNPALTTLSLTVQPAPFTPYGWTTTPVKPWQSGSWASTTLPLLRTDPLPFQAPIEGGKIVRPWRSAWDAQNLLLTTLAAQALADVLPFAQYDWKLPYPRGPVQDFTIAVPVVLQDVPPPAAGSAVTIYSGVSTADGVTYHTGISRPTIKLTPTGPGTYTVEKEHKVSGDLNPGIISQETYLIDGEIP